MLFASDKPEADGDDEQARPRSLNAFSYGVLTQGANPKALIFFSAILPQFVDPHGAIGWQMLILGVSSMVIELACWASMWC